MSFTPFTEADHPTMAAFNEKFREAISEAVEKGLKFELGTYIGTGGYGENNKNSLSFSYPPIVVFISGRGGETDTFLTATLVRGVKRLTSGGAYPTYSFTFDPVTWDKNSVSWCSYLGQYYQANASGETYYYAAILEPPGGETP